MSEVQVQEIIEAKAKTQSPVEPEAQSPAAPQPQADKAAVEQVKSAEANEDPDFARKFAALTKRQKDLFLKERELNERGKKYEDYDRLTKLKDENPWAFAKEVGLDINSLLKGAATEGEAPTIDDKVKTLEDRIAAYEKEKKDAEEKAKQDQEKKSIDDFKKSIHDKVKNESDRFELIILEDEFESVYSVIEQHYLKTQAETGQGEVLAIDKAADLVENYLQERAKKLLTAKKLSLKQDNNQTPKTEEDAPTLGSTLNGSMTATTSAPAPKNETPEEAKARIAAEFNARFKANRKA